MTWIDGSRRLRASALAEDGLRRLAGALGESVEPRRPLHGGVSSSVYELETPTRRLVLKRFRFDDAAPLEWERLHLARDVAVRTPEPVLLDAEGQWFGVPALVTTYLDGVSMYPPEPEVLGRLLATIHATPLPEPVPAVMLRAALWAVWEARVPLPAGVVEAIGELKAIAGREPVVFSHCDFHPGNVLVSGGDVTGVVDWANARAAPAGLDVALCRCDLAIEPGGDGPDRFLSSYEHASGRTVARRPLWDLLAAARAIENGDGWVDAWTDTGVEMTAARIRERAVAFAERALAE